MKKYITSIIAVCFCTAVSAQISGSTNEPYPYDGFEFKVNESTENLRIYSVTHGSVVIKTPFNTIFIDPVAELGGKKFKYGWFKPDDITVLLTHEHGDHLSKQAIDYLADGTGDRNFEVYGNRKSVEALGQGKALNNGDTVSVGCGKVHIRAVPAYNTSKGHLKFHPKGNGNGYLIEIGGLVIYVAGDTELIPEMKELGKVDIAILPVNQPYTMTPEQCIKAAELIKPGVLIPYHMGDTDMTAVVKAFENTGTRVIFHEELR